MKYLILIYTNPQMRDYWAALTDAQRTDAARAHTAVVEELVASGELVTSAPLADLSHVKRVAVTEGRLHTTDGPYAEVKEQRGGGYVGEWESMEGAVEVGGKLPEAAWGMVEVRTTM